MNDVFKGTCSLKLDEKDMVTYSDLQSIGWIESINIDYQLTKKGTKELTKACKTLRKRYVSK